MEQVLCFFTNEKAKITFIWMLWGGRKMRWSITSCFWFLFCLNRKDNQIWSLTISFENQKWTFSLLSVKFPRTFRLNRFLISRCSLKHFHLFMISHHAKQRETIKKNIFIKSYEGIYFIFPSTLISKLLCNLKFHSKRNPKRFLLPYTVKPHNISSPFVFLRTTLSFTFDWNSFKFKLKKVCTLKILKRQGKTNENREN